MHPLVAHSPVPACRALLTWSAIVSFSSLLLSLLPQAACKRGQKDPGTAGSYSAATPCGGLFFDACYASASIQVEQCADFKGNDKCALSDYEAIYRGKHDPCGPTGLSSWAA